MAESAVHHETFDVYVILRLGEDIVKDAFLGVGRLIEAAIEHGAIANS